MGRVNEASTLLAGIRVIEIGQILSAPFASMILADLGADVLKIEKPEGGDDQRRSGPNTKRGDVAVAFHDLNRGKRSRVVDLKSPAGIAELHQLAGEADVLVHNLRPGTAEALGIDGPAFVAAHPRLVYCTVSGFGNAGPLQSRPAFEPIAQAFSGLLSVNGHADGPPARIGASVVDYGTGMWAVIGILSALHRREQTGKGCVIDTSLLESALTWASPHIVGYLNGGREPQRQGTAHPTLVPYQVFETSDGPLMIAAGNDGLFKKLARALNHPEWIDDERFSTSAARMTNRVAIVQAVQDALAHETRSSLLARLTDAGVPCSPMHTIPEAIAHEQVTALTQIQTGVRDDLTLVRLPLSFDGQRPEIRRPAPALGEEHPQ
jgi:crotonobetainyl-CoA:carnitine CoA-transferase CaiB-like acyl-CoA transferase